MMVVCGFRVFPQSEECKKDENFCAHKSNEKEHDSAHRIVDRFVRNLIPPKRGGHGQDYIQKQG